MIDFFYLNTSDTGVGVEEVDTGFGKLSFSVFGVAGTDPANAEFDVTQPSLMFIRPDLRLKGIPVWTGGTLEFDANLISISRHTKHPEDHRRGLRQRLADR